MIAQKLSRSSVTVFCGNEKNPGRGLDNQTEIDYSDTSTSLDQKRIEDVLAARKLAGLRLLHVGIGNSQLAQRLAHRADAIDGITVHAREKERADELHLANYRAFIINKHTRRLADLPSPYDIIIDNNLASFACCMVHFSRMLRTYRQLLREGGFIITDQRGMDWTVDGNDEWKLNYDDLDALGENFGLAVFRLTDCVYALTRPQVPSQTTVSSPTKR